MSNLIDLNEYREFMDDTNFRKVYKQWRDAIWEACGDPVDEASANLTFQGWFGKFKADHDPHFGTCLTEEAVANAIRRCPEPIDTEIVSHDPPVWNYREPGKCQCAYCTYRIVSKHDELFGLVRKGGKR